MGFVAHPLVGANAVLADTRSAQVASLFFGIGAQKAGTTWLHAYLADHPDVMVPSVGVGGKELHYWDSVRAPFKTKYKEMVARRQKERYLRNLAVACLGGRERRQRERQWALYGEALRGGDPSHKAYMDLLFYSWTGQSAVGEISPAYALLDRDTFAEMARLSDRAKFVFIMRDPLGRLLSGLRFGLYKAGITPTSKALTEAAILALGSDPDLSLAKCRYDETICRLESVVPRERISYHFFETLFDQDELDRLTAFLGVAPRRGAVDVRIHEGHGRDATVAIDVLLKARAALDQTYDFIGNRFGSSVPPEWDRSLSRIMPPIRQASA